MKKTLGLLFLAGLPFLSNAQKDSIAKLQNEILILQSQNQNLSARLTKLEDRIPYYENILRLQQAPTVQVMDDFEVRLTKAYFQERENRLIIDAVVTSKKREQIHDLYFDGTMLKCIYPDGRIVQTYTILNNGKQLSTIGPIVNDIPYAFQIVFEKAEKTPKLSALQFRINYTTESPMAGKRIDFVFKGITID